MIYAELHCISNYSFLRGASRPEELVSRAQEQGYTALAITDECSLAGVVRAHEQAKRVGLKLIIGTELRLDDGPRLVLLATNRHGYTQLCRLITRGRRKAAKGAYELYRKDLENSLPDCLALFIPPREPSWDGAGLQWFGRAFSGRGWLAVNLLREGGDEQYLQQWQAAAKNTASRWWPRVMSACMCRRGVPCGTCCPPFAITAPWRNWAAGPCSTGNGICAPWKISSHSTRHRCCSRAWASPGAAVFPWTNCATTIPMMSRRRVCSPRTTCGSWWKRAKRRAGQKAVRTGCRRRSNMSCG